MQPLFSLWTGGTLFQRLSTTQRTAGKWEGATASGPSVAHEIESPHDYSKQTMKQDGLKNINDTPLFQNPKLINLIGKKCMVHCLLDGIPAEVLWDTVAQASVINEEWRKENIPHRTVRPLHELLESSTLVGLAINQTVIPFLGWIEAEFSFGQDSSAISLLLVPLTHM